LAILAIALTKSYIALAKFYCAHVLYHWGYGSKAN